MSRKKWKINIFVAFPLKINLSVVICTKLKSVFKTRSEGWGKVTNIFFAFESIFHILISNNDILNHLGLYIYNILFWECNQDLSNGSWVYVFS